MKVIYSLFTHFFLRWLSFFNVLRLSASLSCSGLISEHLQFILFSLRSFSSQYTVFMVTLFFLFQFLSESFSVLRPVFYSDIYFLSFSFCSSCYFCLFFSPLLYSYHFFFIIFFLSVPLSVLSFHLLPLSGFICRSCNITKARFAVSAITEKQITRMHNIIRQCTTLYIYVAPYITHCVSAVALITQYSLSS